MRENEWAAARAAEQLSSAVGRLPREGTMNRLEWTDLMIRLFAAFNILSAFLAAGPVVQLVTTVYPAATGEPLIPAAAAYTFFALVFLLPVVVCIIIWRRSWRIAAWLWRNRPDVPATPEASGPSERNEFALFSVLGLYILLTTIPSLLGNLGRVWQYTLVSPGGPLLSLLDITEWSYLLGQLLQIALAALLLLRPAKVWRVLSRREGL
jgi:hypothetical protein